jgi:hypothetical protein
MTIFRVVEFEDGRSITVDSTSKLLGRVTVSYVVEPNSADQSRLVVKVIYKTNRGLLGLLGRLFLPAGDLVMMRKQLLTLKALAEQGAATAA